MNLKKKQPQWDREEVVLVVSEYFRTKDLGSHAIGMGKENVSKLLRVRGELVHGQIDNTYRNFNGIDMKYGNIKSLDPEYTLEGKCGLSSASKLEKLVVEEYLNAPEIVIREAYVMVMKYIEYLK